MEMVQQTLIMILIIKMKAQKLYMILEFVQLHEYTHKA